MGHAVQQNRPHANPFSDLSPRIHAAYDRRRKYGKVLRELSTMSARELTDINLTRGDIRRVAREAMDL